MNKKNRNNGPIVHGWLALDKPLGLTSTQALGKARRLIGGTKVGHGGTLDPLATGILPLAFGEATKVIPFIMDSDKEYLFTITWGENRATEDSEGAVTATSDARPTEDQIRTSLPHFIGEIAQVPPSFSAIKVDGERAYDMARAGKVVKLAARQVVVHAFELTGIASPHQASFRLSCGKGTYVRALARDLAAVLGVCGYVSALRRTKVGPFMVENSCSIAKLEGLAAENTTSDAVFSIKSALGAVKTLNLTDAEAHTLKLGQKIMIRPQHGDIFQAKVIFAEHRGVPVAMVEPIAGELHVLRGFHF